jgi:hypothetical protein
MLLRITTVLSIFSDYNIVIIGIIVFYAGGSFFLRYRFKYRF